MYTQLRLLIAVFSFVGFGIITTGCTITPKDKLANITEQKLYTTAQNYIRRSEFILAVEALQKLESDFPFGKYANSAQLALIYAYYKSNELPLAQSAANRYIRLHPNHRNVDYAYYMRGLTTFPNHASFFQSTFKTDLSKREMKSAKTAFVHFSELTRRFPDSQYTPDATKRMEYLRNLLARHEIIIANYYLDREAFLAAANRGRYVVENYQRTPSIPDALAIMIQSYHEMNMPKLADNSLQVLKLNYPHYPALTDDGVFNFSFYKKRKKALSSLLTLGIIDISTPPGFDTRKQYSQ